jgi:hypothetical protein
MPKFIQKLVAVEAVQFTGENIPEILKFCGGCFQEGKELRINLPNVGKDAPKDKQSVALTPGSWVQRGPDGTFFPCNATFLDYFEPIE